MEELRDERLGKIVSWMQAYIRGYLSRKDYQKLQEQRLALVIVQRNLRKYLQLRTWPWWKLWQKIKPLLNVTRIEDEMAVSVSPGSRDLMNFLNILANHNGTFDKFVQRVHRRQIYSFSLQFYASREHKK